MLLIDGIVILLFIGLGILFLKGKGAFLIAGYNTASEEKKNTISEKALCGFMGKLMFVFAGCHLIIALSAVFDKAYLSWIGIGAYIVIAVGAVIYANTGNRFKK